MWILQSVEPADAGLTFRLLPGTLKTMGRAPRADFVVDAALVSRVHCRFTLNNTNELELEDLGSTNGTFVDNARVTGPVALDEAQSIRIGDATLTFRTRSRANAPTKKIKRKN
jgi:pSer/pThr/pTyr-binding forkhead associated (FHA) protein